MYGSKKRYQAARRTPTQNTSPIPAVLHIPTFICSKCKRVNTIDVTHITVALDEYKLGELYNKRIAFHKVCNTCAIALKEWFK